MAANRRKFDEDFKAGAVRIVRETGAIHASDTRLHLAVTDTDLDELIGAVAAEANHEPNRRRQQRLDAAFEALNTAADTQGW